MDHENKDELVCIDSDSTDCDTEYELPPLLVEHVEPPPEEAKLVGRRIVNIAHVLNQLQIIAKHSQVCTMGKYVFEKEIVSGLFSRWIYNCDNCGKSYTVTSDSLDLKEECNDAFVWGSLSIGIGYAQAQEMLSIMDVPVMGTAKFRAHERKIGKVSGPTINYA